MTTPFPGGVKLVLWVPFLSEIMQSRKRFQHVSKMFEDTKGAIRICKSKKDKLYNGQKKKDIQRSTKYYTETKERAT